LGFSFRDFSRVFTGFHGFSRFFTVFHGFSRFFTVFHGFSRFFRGFSRFFTVFHGFSRFFAVFRGFFSLSSRLFEALGRPKTRNGVPRSTRLHQLRTVFGAKNLFLLLLPNQKNESRAVEAAVGGGVTPRQRPMLPRASRSNRPLRRESPLDETAVQEKLIFYSCRPFYFPARKGGA
jgi:hypothetical protein